MHFRERKYLYFDIFSIWSDWPALVQEIAWHLTGAKPFSEPMLTKMPDHIASPNPNELINYVVAHAVKYNLYISAVFIMSSAQLTVDHY